jgi:hypothetical protein
VSALRTTCIPVARGLIELIELLAVIQFDR